MPLCERLFWSKAGKQYLCIVMNPTRAAKIDGAGSLGGEVTNDVLNIELKFKNACANLKNERTGRVIGDGKSFADQWTASEANIYSFDSNN